MLNSRVFIHTINVCMETNVQLNLFWVEVYMVPFLKTINEAKLTNFIKSLYLEVYFSSVVMPPQTAILLFCISFSWGWS